MLGWLRLLARSFAALRRYGLRALLTHWRVEPLRCCTKCCAARLPGEESRPLFASTESATLPWAVVGLWIGRTRARVLSPSKLCESDLRL